MQAYLIIQRRTMMNKQIYEMKQIKDANVLSSNIYKYLIIAPNREERSRELYKKVKNVGAAENVIAVDFANFHKDTTGKKEDVYLEELAENSVDLIKVNSDAEAIIKLSKLKIDKEDRVAMDITGFSIPNIYQLIKLFKDKIKINKFDVFYTEPKFYIYDKGYLDSYHHNNIDIENIKKIDQRICAPLIGFYQSGKNEKEVLVILIGFDKGLAGMVYNKLVEESPEIKETYIVNGFPSYTAKLKDVSLLNNEDIISKLENPSDSIVYAAANNPFDTYNTLHVLHENSKNLGALFNLCSIGSKPMALGACLFALDHSNSVKVTYPMYEKTFFDIKEKAGKIWKYGIEF